MGVTREDAPFELTDHARAVLAEKADALYLRIHDSPISGSEETAPGIILNYNVEDEVVGIEILGVKRRYPSRTFAVWKSRFLRAAAAL